MAKRKLKMWVWEGVLSDYFPGLVVALAETPEQGIELFRSGADWYIFDGHVNGVKIDGVEPVGYDRPHAVFITGGN